MTTTVETTTGVADGRTRSPDGEGSSRMRLRLTQALAVARLEIGRNFFGLRAMGLYLLALLPILALAAPAWVRTAGLFGAEAPAAPELVVEYAFFYRNVVLRLVLFFISVLVFTRLFRAEIQQRSLHYYFLTPVRREVLAAGKFAAGLVAATLVVCSTVAATFLLHLLPLTASAGAGGYGAFLLRGGGLGQLAAYLGIGLLGVVGYGAVFFAAGLWVKNPIVPAVLVFGWEWLHFLLPPVLKRLSVIHYLHALKPVPVSEGDIAILSNPPAPWIAVLGLLALAAVLLVLSARKVRRMEVSYGEE